MKYSSSRASTWRRCARRLSGDCTARPSDYLSFRMCSRVRRHCFRRYRANRIGRSASHQCLVAVHILDRCLGHVLRGSHDDPSLHAGAFRRHFFDERPEVRIQEDVLVLGVIDDVDNLLGKQSRINRVTNIAAAGARVIGLEMPIVVPSQRCDTIATREPQALIALASFRARANESA